MGFAGLTEERGGDILGEMREGWVDGDAAGAAGDGRAHGAGYLQGPVGIWVGAVLRSVCPGRFGVCGAECYSLLGKAPVFPAAYHAGRRQTGPSFGFLSDAGAAGRRLVPVLSFSPAGAGGRLAAGDHSCAGAAFVVRSCGFGRFCADVSDLGADGHQMAGALSAVLVGALCESGSGREDMPPGAPGI